MSILPGSISTALPSPDTVRAGLQRPKHTRLRLDRFPLGVDEQHIDVALGPGLTRAVSIFVGALVREMVHDLWKRPATQSSDVLLDNLRQVIRDYHRTAVKEARVSNSRERVQLFQLALLKLIFHQIDKELAALRHELEEARTRSEAQFNGQSLHFHQQAVVLGRHAPHVRYQVARQLIRELMRLEHGGMRNLRQSVLGLAWPVPEPMLTNPLLQLDGIGNQKDFSRNYPALLHNLATARDLCLCLFAALGEWVPANVGVPPERSAGVRAASSSGRHDHGAAHGLIDTERWSRCLIDETELNDAGGSWLDEPSNVVALLGGSGDDWPHPGNWQHRGIGRVQRKLNRRFLARLGKTGLMSRAYAAYEFSAIYPALGLVDAESLISSFLQKEINRRELGKRLEAMSGIADINALMRRIDSLRKDFRDRPGSGKHQLAARLAGDILSLRRDLKLGLRAFQAMDRICLLDDEGDLNLSRAGSVLQLFCLDDQADDQRGNVTGHVIVKVETRGVTTLISEMRRRDLNPTPYFSRFFYDPLERIRAMFDAQKVAVDGDSLIMSILEYGGEGAERLAVARACCLAGKMLEMVGQMNTESERQGLHGVELGIGIAYADEAPVYLYDQSRRVLISPAISRARQMSSCNLLMRESCPLPGGRGVCVASPVSGDPGINGQEQGLVRFNVNGIELDDAAFVALNREITLSKMRIREKKSRRSLNYYAGQCPDTKGGTHWLVIREQPVKLWMGRQLLETSEEGRSFFEVVSDARLIGRIREQLEQQTKRSHQTAAAARL